jgi:roadblock/LC7 domain-containing protein
VAGLAAAPQLVEHALVDALLSGDEPVQIEVADEPIVCHAGDACASSAENALTATLTMGIKLRLVADRGRSEEAEMSAEMRVRTEPVCSLPAGSTPDAITSDGHVIAFILTEDGRLSFVWDGVAGEPFDELFELRDASAAVFSSDDGAHIAYAGRRGEASFVGWDNREDPPREGFSRSVLPTLGGARHLAYGAHVDGVFRLILDGKPVGTHALAPVAVAFSHDGERLAFMEIRGESRKEAECRIVLDGTAGGWFKGTRNAPGAMQFSPDGRRFAYYAIDGTSHARWYVDDVAQRLFNERSMMTLNRLRGIAVLEPPLPARFSPDGRRFAYFADVLEKGVAIVEDDVPGPLFKGAGMPVFSPDSRHLAYVAQTSDKELALVLDGALVGGWPATSAGEPVFSQDSRRVAVMLQREAGGFLRKRKVFAVAVDGDLHAEAPGDDASGVPAFSPDGARLAWWLQRGDDGFVVIDGIVQQDVPALVSDLRFDPSGRLVYGGQAGPYQTIVVDGRPGPPADSILMLTPSKAIYGHDPSLPAAVPFRFSADGRHVAWAGLFDGEACPVFDDEVGPGFDLIVDCGFDNDGSAVWWAQRGEEMFRVKRSP